MVYIRVLACAAMADSESSTRPVLAAGSVGAWTSSEPAAGAVALVAAPVSVAASESGATEAGVTAGSDCCSSATVYLLACSCTSTAAGDQGCFSSSLIIYH